MIVFRLQLTFIFIMDSSDDWSVNHLVYKMSENHSFLKPKVMFCSTNWEKQQILTNDELENDRKQLND